MKNKSKYEIIRQKKAIESKYNDELEKQGYYIPETSGIYIFAREEKVRYAYIGQSVNLRQRVIEHCLGHKQHIDRSIDSRKLYSKDNQGGWFITYKQYNKFDLNKMEREIIKKYQEMGYHLYNITSGGQDEGKVDINERKEPKGYKKGVAKGKEQVLNEVRTYFVKYLEAEIKGNTNKIKERKLKEFYELLGIKKESSNDN